MTANTPFTVHSPLSLTSLPAPGDDASNSFNPVKGEMALWTAVITQALMDAGSQSHKPEAQQEKSKAIRWLLGNCDDFKTVCLNAGLDPIYIRQKAIEAIERGCVWRRGMAEQRAAKTASAPKSAAKSPTKSPAIERKMHIPRIPAQQPRFPARRQKPLSGTATLHTTAPVTCLRYYHEPAPRCLLN